MKKKKILVAFDPRAYEAVSRYARSSGLTVTALVRMAALQEVGYVANQPEKEVQHDA